MIVVDRKCPILSKAIKEYDDIIGMCNYERFEKNILNHEEFKKAFFLDRVAFHHALVERAVETAYHLYTDKLESNIQPILKKKYKWVIFDIFSSHVEI